MSGSLIDDVVEAKEAVEANPTNSANWPQLLSALGSLNENAPEAFAEFDDFEEDHPDGAYGANAFVLKAIERMPVNGGEPFVKPRMTLVRENDNRISVMSHVAARLQDENPVIYYRLISEYLERTKVGGWAHLLRISRQYVEDDPTTDEWK